MAKAAADFEAYKSSFSPAAPPVSNLTAPSISTGGTTATAPATVAPGGIGSTVPSSPISTTPQNPVYGPDGTEYPSASDAISAGIYNYTTYKPIATPTFNFGTSTGETNPFALTTGTTNPFASPTQTDSSGIGMFAQGGIAAMAPSRFRTGSSPMGTAAFPRKTGPINGPGTGTSDSIPAMLSDGEFVFTAKSVRNFGNGSRKEGARKMYAMMKALERKS